MKMEEIEREGVAERAIRKALNWKELDVSKFFALEGKTRWIGGG
jgi:hypothetical protein